MGICFQKKDLVISHLPNGNKKFRKCLREAGLEILEAAEFGDMFTVVDQRYAVHFLQTTSFPNPDIVAFDDYWVVGTFHLTGELYFRSRQPLVGVFSWAQQHKGFMWGTEFARRLAPL